MSKHTVVVTAHVVVDTDIVSDFGPDATVTSVSIVGQVPGHTLKLNRVSAFLKEGGHILSVRKIAAAKAPGPVHRVVVPNTGTDGGHTPAADDDFAMPGAGAAPTPIAVSEKMLQAVGMINSLPMKDRLEWYKGLSEPHRAQAKAGGLKIVGR